MTTPLCAADAVCGAFSRTPRVLVVDGDAALRRRLARELGRLGHHVETAANGEIALARIETVAPDVVLLDLSLAGMHCLDILQRIRRLLPGLPMIALAAPGAAEAAVDALKLGAHDVMSKPLEIDRLAVAVRNALAIGRLARQVQDLRRELHARHRLEGVVGAEGGLSQVVRMVEKVIPTDLTVLLQGESGVGKEVFARAIHHEGPRCDGPLVVIDCGLRPEALLESELFGHEAGACPGVIGARVGQFERADGGTVVLDEIAELSPALQGKLQRALRERAIRRLGGEAPIPVDVRVICTSSRDLSEEAQEGRFLEDLYYRVTVFPVVLPPLRERREDIPALARHVLDAGRFGAGSTVTPGAMDMLEAYDWPGNVRELQNVLRRALVLSSAGPIRPEHLPAQVQASLGDAWRDGAAKRTSAAVAPRSGRGEAGPAVRLEDIERAHILRTIDLCEGNLSEAARALDIGRTTLYRKLQRYGVAPASVA